MKHLASVSIPASRRVVDREGIRPLEARHATMRNAPVLATPAGYTHAQPTAREVNKGLRAPRGYDRVMWVTARPAGTHHASVVCGALCTTADGTRYYHTRKKDGTIGQCGTRVACGARHVRLTTLEAIVGVGRAQGYDIRLVSCGDVVPADGTHTPTSHKTRKVCRACAGTRKQPASKPNRKPAGPEMFIPPVRY